ncbi:amidohydrolase [Hyphococcus flavus]|uniref:Amidohydrolase n=1 Tax=Hyphococcus flavus TaxID=1866326 RepID=A0AAE9ZAG2_9PROT|nr:amidohydrolase [Hyphococcus flavus]WDI30076.1 amidohydrolase [Hyphococcus flavus]
MNCYSRRSLITGAAGCGAFLAAGSARAAVNFGTADAIILAKKIYSMDPSIGEVSGVAISRDKILAVGSHDDMRMIAGPSTKIIDARDQIIMPGFIDSHSHPLMANEAISVDVNLRRIADVQDALRQRAEKTEPGEWVLGHAYDDTKFEGGLPVTRVDLDAVSTRHPILIIHRGGHTGVANSAAFDAVGVTIETPDPEGGKFYRENGAFTGRVAEKALYVFYRAENYPVSSRADNQRNAALSTKRMAAAGLTSVTDAYCSPDEYTAYLDAHHADDLNVRIGIMPGANNSGNGSLYQMLKDLNYRSGDGGHMVRIDAVKHSADGSASERTMRMSTPFEGRPDDFGILTMTQEEIDAAVDDAVAHGFRIGIHANGDVTIDMVLKAYERVLKEWRGPNPRFRIEHCSLVNHDLLKRIKKTGAIPAPFYTYAHYHGNKWTEYGAEKMEWMFAHKSFIDYGIPVAPASDYLPGPYEPMMALQSLTTRKDFAGRVWGESQKISIQQAMKVCTVNGAYASMEENVKGTLTPGKFADVVMLADDPVAVDPEALKEIKVTRTIMGGRTTFEA